MGAEALFLTGLSPLTASVPRGAVKHCQTCQESHPGNDTEEALIWDQSQSFLCQ